MVCIGATIGKTGFSERIVTSNQQINALTPKSEFEARFFYYALTTDIFFNKIMQASSQATLPIINKSKWENLTVPFPNDKKEQIEIVKRLDTLSVEAIKLQEKYETKLEKLEELKSGILKRAFENELIEAE
jgi:type I restriction enzyme S subunit